MSPRLAIIDYGVGGLDLVKRIKTDRPYIGLTYFSDAGEVPYGKLTKAALKKRVERVISFLRTQGCSHIVVACHAASSVMADDPHKHLRTMVPYTLNCLSPTPSIKSLGIIGGGRTVRSGRYRDHFKAMGINVQQKVAQELSILIERGETSGSHLQNTLKKLLTPLHDMDALLLACTHYPVLKEYLHLYLKKDCLPIDPMHHMYGQLATEWPQFPAGNDTYFTTGSTTNMVRVAEKVYGLDLKDTIGLGRRLP